MKTISAFLLILLLWVPVAAQEKVVEWSFETMVYSQYSWRGQELSNAPTFIPSVEIAAGNFSFLVWGAKATNKTYSEIDLIPSYSIGNFTLEMCDYYVPDQGEKNNYFNFRENESRHSLEFTVRHNPSDKFPVKWSFGSFVAGDKNPETGKQFFSSYLEVAYPFSLIGVEICPLLGLTPHQGFYADKFALINSGLTAEKDLSLGKNWCLPIRLNTSYNPYSDQFFVDVAIGVRFN